MTSGLQLASAEPVLETAMYLRSGSEAVFAIHTPSAHAQPSIGVVLAHSGANNFSSHRNAVWTTICRRLAEQGIPSLRFDFAGTGESSGVFTPALAGQPIADTNVAIDALRATGCERVLLVGSCFGAIPAAVASVARGDIAGVVLLSPPLVILSGGRVTSLRDRIREAINGQSLRLVVTNGEYRRWFFARLSSLARTRVGAEFSRRKTRTPPAGAPERSPDANATGGLLLEAELARLVTGGTPVEIVYGTADANLTLVQENAHAVRALGLLRERHPALLTWTVLEGPVHGLEDVAVQEQLIALVLTRASGLRAPAA